MKCYLSVTIKIHDLNLSKGDCMLCFEETAAHRTISFGRMATVCLHPSLSHIFDFS